MNTPQKTAIVTGASQGIGAGIVKAFVEHGFNVVANSRKVTQSTEVAASSHVALVDGDILSEAGRFLNSTRTILRTFRFSSLPNCHFKPHPALAMSELRNSQVIGTSAAQR